MLCVYVTGAPLVFLCRSTFRYHTLIMSCRPSGGNESLRLSIEHYLLATKHNTIEVLRKETFVIDLYICIVLAFKALHSPFWVKPMTPGKTGTFFKWNDGYLPLICMDMARLLDVFVFPANVKPLPLRISGRVLLCNWRIFYRARAPKMSSCWRTNVQPRVRNGALVESTIRTTSAKHRKKLPKSRWLGGNHTKSLRGVLGLWFGPGLNAFRLT